MSRIRAHLRSNVVGYLALFVALSGTAYAAGTIGTEDIVDNSVRSVDVRDATDTGGGLTAADLRTESVGSSELLDDHVLGADVNEASLGRVPRATDSEKLGGSSPAEFQRRVTGSCAAGAVRSIASNGAVSCTKPSVFSISNDLSSNAGESVAFNNISSSNLRVINQCTESSATARFTNEGAGGATLNWVFSQGGTSSTVNASGTSLGPSGDQVLFTFANRIEGQWIFADADGVTTVNLHGFYLPGVPAFCEFKGTAVWAPA